MALDFAHEYLGWPDREAIFSPSGAGPRVLAKLARAKLENALRLLANVRGVNVGVLFENPASDATETPLAVVCEFDHGVSLPILAEAHRLAWNFSRAPLLITAEPHVLRAWSCYEPPMPLGTFDPFPPQIVEIPATIPQGTSIEEQAARALDWVDLVSGEFFRRHPGRFHRERAADGMLLQNLLYVRQRLGELKLDADISHDLIARLIFIQFLFQRKDSSGNPALTEKVLRDLHAQGALRHRHRTLVDILNDYEDAYEFFRWLNNKFNGDLFPGQGATEDEREEEWTTEMQAVKPAHLELLAQFVSGEIDMRSGQPSFWPQYAFDAIPLEFISSIYEAFANKDEGTGVYYTPAHVVDFMLDAVLPWDDECWDVRILDPACGSGIFLVKSFQRLVHRWRLAHPGEEPAAEQLRRLLERNLFGVDLDPHAVRVASFSLYLAMCDEIDPRHYWRTVRFPRLRDHRLIYSDFFSDDLEGFRTKEDAGAYDLVVGNAPWAARSITPAARDWSRVHKWRPPYK
nr:N-6 DNA methylase [Gemmatimonadota bacterium]